MAKKKKIIRGTCVYCGKDSELSEDHVIPQCLFNNNLPRDMPIVYACYSCNHVVKSGLDTYLRDFLILDIESSEHPIAQQLFHKFARAVRRNQSKMAHDANKSQLIPRLTSSGLFAGWVYATELPREQITAILTMIVKGLYYAYMGIRLPKNSKFEVTRVLDKSQLETNLGIILQLGGRYISTGNGEVFECVFACAREKPEVSLWYICFYRRVIFLVSTNRSIR